MIEHSREADLERISIVECKREWLLCGRQIANTEEDYIKAFVEHTQSVAGPRLYNRIYGTMISLQKIKDGNYNDDDCFYTKVPSPQKKEGCYIRAYSKGDWDKLPGTFQKILDFADKHNLALTGYAYEEGLNEMTIQDMDEYVTQMTIRIDKVNSMRVK